MKVDKAVCTNDTINDLHDRNRYEVILSTLVENKILAIKRDCERNEKKLKEQRKQNCLAGFTFGKRIRLRHTGNSNSNNSNNQTNVSSSTRSSNHKKSDKYVDIEAATGVDHASNTSKMDESFSDGKKCGATTDSDTPMKNAYLDKDESALPSSKQQIILNKTTSDATALKNENRDVNASDVLENVFTSLHGNDSVKGCAKFTDNRSHNNECNGSNNMNEIRQSDRITTLKMENNNKDNNANESLLHAQKVHNGNDVLDTNRISEKKTSMVQSIERKDNTEDVNKCQMVTVDNKKCEQTQRQHVNTERKTDAIITMATVETIAVASPTITNNVDIYVSDDSIKQTIRKYSSDTISYPSSSKQAFSAPEASFLVEHERHRLKVLEAKSVSAQCSPIFPRQLFGHTGTQASTLSPHSNKKHGAGILNIKPFKLHSRQNTSEDSMNVTFNNVLVNENAEDDSKDVSEHSSDSRKKTQAKKILKKDKLDRSNNNNNNSNINKTQTQIQTNSNSKSESFGFISSFNQLTSGNLPVIATSKYRTVQYNDDDGRASISDISKLQSVRMKRERFEKKTSSSIRSSISGNSGETDDGFYTNKRVFSEY